MEKVRNAYNILAGKPEGKRLVGKHRHRWEDSSKMDLKQVRCEGVGWLHLAPDRDHWAGSSEHDSEPLLSIKCWEFFD